MFLGSKVEPLNARAPAAAMEKNQQASGGAAGVVGDVNKNAGGISDEMWKMLGMDNDNDPLAPLAF